MIFRKIISIIFFLIFTQFFIFPQGFKEFIGGECDYSSNVKYKIGKWLNKGYKDAVNAINNGINGRKLPQCKINEINKLLHQVGLYYSCSDENCKGNCGTGSNKIRR